MGLLQQSLPQCSIPHWPLGRPHPRLFIMAYPAAIALSPRTADSRWPFFRCKLNLSQVACSRECMNTRRCTGAAILICSQGADWPFRDCNQVLSEDTLIEAAVRSAAGATLQSLLKWRNQVLPVLTLHRLSKPPLEPYCVRKIFTRLFL